MKQDFKIDDCYRSKEDLKKLAKHLDFVEKEIIQWLETKMSHNQNSIEFLQGLVAGYAGASVLAKQIPINQYPPLINSITAFLAHKIQNA